MALLTPTKSAKAERIAAGARSAFASAADSLEVAAQLQREVAAEARTEAVRLHNEADAASVAAQQNSTAAGNLRTLIGA